MSAFEIISDYSKAGLREIPENVLEMTNLKMLFLERNFLIKLPDNFFHKLPNLMWLDLRNNQLEEIPSSVAHHAHLEHLLLTNNNIRKLPNELGLVLNLKALQVADNPLIYPSKKIVQDGTKSIKRYLQEQYAKNAEKQRKIMDSKEEFRYLIEKPETAVMQDEKLIKIHEKISENEYFDHSYNIPKRSFQNADQYNINNFGGWMSSNPRNDILIEDVRNKLGNSDSIYPTLRVNKIENPNKRQEEPLKIIHHVSKNESKISLKSYFNRPGIKGDLGEIPESMLKEGWLNRLRLLLNDQERILQQERNLRALSEWREKRPSTPKIFCDRNSNAERSEAPYATYPEYSRIPSRAELTSQLQAFLMESEYLNTKPVQTSQMNLDKIINDLVQQLAEIETSCSTVRSPRSAIDNAGRQIQTIVDIHKKLLQLKSTNDYL